MKNLENKILLLYIILIINCLIVHIFLANSLAKYDLYLTPVIWLGIFLFTYFITKDEKSRYKAKTDKVETIFIIILCYLMIYFASGLFLGYVRSPYSHDIISVVKNIWSFCTVIIFEEYVRTVLVGYTRNRKELYVLIVLIFTLTEINFYHIESNFMTGELAFKYLSSVIFPTLVKNILFTYLAVVAGTLANLTYRIPMSLATIILPIFPDFNWFIKGITESLLPLFVYLFINKIHEKKTIRYIDRRKKSHEWIVTIILIILVFFVAGFFKYKPIAILSNSMADVFYRGDVVIVEKIDPDTVELQDIIEYKLEGYSIFHRVIEIEKTEDGSKIYRTKGDNNSAPDEKWVESDQIVGKVRLRIPKIGFPIVWINEFVKDGATVVEAPK